MTLVPCPSHVASEAVSTAAAAMPLPPQRDSQGLRGQVMGRLGSRLRKSLRAREPEAGGAERSYEYRKRSGRTSLSAAYWV